MDDSGKPLISPRTSNNLQTFATKIFNLRTDEISRSAGQLPGIVKTDKNTNRIEPGEPDEYDEKGKIKTLRQVSKSTTTSPNPSPREHKDSFGFSRSKTPKTRDEMKLLRKKTTPTYSPPSQLYNNNTSPTSLYTLPDRTATNKKAFKVLGLDKPAVVKKDLQKVALKEAGLFLGAKQTNSSNGTDTGSFPFIKRRKSVPSLHGVHNLSKDFNKRKNSLGNVPTSVKFRTLNQIWEQPIFRKVFCDYLDDHFCNESKVFLEEVSKFEHIEDDTARTILGKNIINRFFQENADDQINIDFNTSTELQNLIKNDKLEPNTFDSAKKIIFDLLEKDVFQRFLQSAEFITMLVDAGENVPDCTEHGDTLGRRKKEPEPIRLQDLKYIKEVCQDIHQSLLDSQWVFELQLDSSSSGKRIPVGRIVVVTSQNIFTIQHTLLLRTKGYFFDILSLQKLSAFPDENNIRLDMNFIVNDSPHFLSLLCNYSACQHLCTSIIDAAAACFSLHPRLTRPEFIVLNSSLHYPEEERFSRVVNNAISRFQAKDDLLHDNHKKDAIIHKLSYELNKQKATLEDTIITLTNQCNVQSQRIIDLSDEISELKNVKDTQVSRISDIMQKQAKEQKKEIDRLTTDLAGAESTNKELQKKYDLLQKATVTSLSELQIKNEQLENEIQHSDWKLSRAKRGFESKEKHFQQQCDILNTEKSATQEQDSAKIINLQDEISRLNAIIEEKDRIIEQSKET